MMSIPDGKAAVEGREPETELLFSCLSACMDAGRADRISTLLRQDLDWVFLMQVAGWHGVMPLLYWNLHAIGAEAVPQPVLEQLRSSFQLNACRSLSLTHELCELLQLFAAHDIPAIPYKGPALAAYAYGNVTLRQFSDLDILVRQRHVLRAKELLLARGYHPTYQLTPWQEAARLHASCECLFDRAEPRVHLDMQWRIAPRYFPWPFELEAVWPHLETVSLASTSVVSLPAPELLLILCVHGVQHRWERLKWIVDIAALLHAHPEIDWHRVMELARTLGSERLLYLGLFLAHALLEADLPEEVLGKLQADPVIPTLAAQVSHRLFHETSGQPGFFVHARFMCQARERWQDRVRYCYRSGLYHTIRSGFRLGVKYGLRPWRSLVQS